jgi:hypothetical protein
VRLPREHELLDLWERTADRSSSFRALALLRAAHPESAWEELEQLSIGERDQRLLKLRAQLFGPSAEMLSCCPACGEKVESVLPIRTLCEQSSPPAVAVENTLDVDGHRVCFRLLAAGDLLAIERCAPELAREKLLERCVQWATNAQEKAVSPRELPAPVVSAVTAAMEAADTAAYLEVGLTCVSCGHSWHTVFDIARYIWREIGSWATRTLLDVHRIARAYGWTEAETLALSPTRRQIYLELIAA